MMVAMLAIAALVLDTGMLFHARREVATIADSAALAGAVEYAKVVLSGSTSEEAASAAGFKAREYAQRNGATEDEISVTVSEADRKLTVRVTRVAEMTFARLLGVPSSPVTARAAARTGPVFAADPSKGVIPVYVSSSVTSYLNQQLVLRDGTPPPSDPGNFTALALGGPGASTYADNLEFGYSGTVKKGDMVDTQPGNIANPTKTALQNRIDRCTNDCDYPCTYSDHTDRCPRTVTLLVCSYTNLHGRDEIKVEGFVTFFIQSVQKTGGNVRITGYVINDIRSGQVAGQDGTPGTDYGTWAVNLTE
jgi:hypothetical protein